MLWRCLVFLMVPASLWAASWSVARDEHFEVYSQAGPAAAKEALAWFEQLRVFFQEQTSLSPVPPTRLRVIGFVSSKEYDAYRLRPGADAYYAGYGDDNYIVMPSLQSRQWEVAAHEYVHALLHTRGGKLPAWLNEGLADVYSTVRVSEKGSTVGEEAPGRLGVLRRRGAMPLAELLSAGEDRFQQSDREAASWLYAQSWALTHLLLFAPEYRGRLPALLTALAGGGESRAALEQVYGRTLGSISQDVQRWTGQGHYLGVPMLGIARSTGLVTVEEVSPYAGRVLLADLVWTIGDLPRAASLYTQLAKEDPKDAHVPAMQGAIALRQGEKAIARRYWRQALSLGVQDATLCYRFATLAQDEGEPVDEVRRALARAIALRPDYDEARYTLGLLESNAGREEEAVTQFRAMRRIAPERAFFYWCALAEAWLALDRRNEAKQAASEAKQFARDAAQRARVAQIGYLADTDLTVQFTRDAEGRVHLATTRAPHNAPRWNPFIERTDRVQRLEGTLREIRCEDVTRLVVEQSPGTDVVLAIPDPARVQMRNAPAEFTCGVQEDRPAVLVEYAAASKETEAGVVRGLEFMGRRQ